MTSSQPDPLFPDLDRRRLPQHIAIIMDGNGRWAKKRGLPHIQGHTKGLDAAREIIKTCVRLKIPYLTLYAFSTENWGRPSGEVNALFGLMTKAIARELPDLLKYNVRLRTIGDPARLPATARDAVRDAIERTAGGAELTLTVALSYSSRDELVRAMRQAAADALTGALDVEQLDEQAFAGYLDTAGMPDPDLLIRTSGEMRLSNFLLWQIAYSELFITETLWPDFSPDEFHRALSTFAGRERRFGQTSEQLAADD